MGRQIVHRVRGDAHRGIKAALAQMAYFADELVDLRLLAHDDLVEFVQQVL
jgi:hypothetical protein